MLAVRVEFFIAVPEGNVVYHYTGSVWANPFVLAKDGKVLGCFCKQGAVERCHAQVLVRLWREKRGM